MFDPPLFYILAGTPTVKLPANMFAVSAASYEFAQILDEVATADKEFEWEMPHIHPNAVLRVLCVVHKTEDQNTLDQIASSPEPKVMRDTTIMTREYRFNCMEDTLDEYMGDYIDSLNSSFNFEAARYWLEAAYIMGHGAAFSHIAQAMVLRHEGGFWDLAGPDHNFHFNLAMGLEQLRAGTRLQITEQTLRVIKSAESSEILLRGLKQLAPITSIHALLKVLGDMSGQNEHSVAANWLLVRRELYQTSCIIADAAVVSLDDFR